MIYLIQPPRNEGYHSNSRTACYPPLGLALMATFIKIELPKLQVKVLDGELLSIDEIIKTVQPNSIVGLDTKLLNYKSAIQIAKVVKDKGCKLIVGGVFASKMYKEIEKYRSNIIDHIVVGFGEYPFVNIIKGNEKNKIVFNLNPNFNNLPIPDRNHVDMETYINNFYEQHPTWSKRGTHMFTHMGCLDNCYFCSRQGPKSGAYYRNPKFIWQEVRELVERYNIDYIVDFSDGITQNLKWLEELVESKPNDLNPSFHVFSKVDKINLKSIELLNKLNVKHIFVGIETGDPILAKNLGKGVNYSPFDAINAVKQIIRASFTLTPSFVLGLLGENEESLEKTYQLAKLIQEVSEFEEIFCSTLIPFPGSGAFNMLKLKYNLDSDLLDSEQLSKLWVQLYCGVGFKTICSYRDKILDLGKYKITIKKN
ncbi:B12-binding domain-containing radical SAM protein [Nanoarchaeota archaeon]